MAVGTLAACTQTVEDPRATEDSLRVVVDTCPQWQAWAANPSVTGIVAAIQRRPGRAARYPLSCPTVYVGGQAYAGFDVGDYTIFHEPHEGPKDCSSMTIADVMKIEWGPIWEYARLRGLYCGYFPASSRDPAASLAALDAAVEAQVPTWVSSADFSVSYTDVRTPPFEMIDGFPGGHGCTTCY